VRVGSGVSLCLAHYNDGAGANLTDRISNLRKNLLQSWKTNVECAENYNTNFVLRDVLLMTETLVGCDEYVEGQ